MILTSCLEHFSTSNLVKQHRNACYSEGAWQKLLAMPVRPLLVSLPAYLAMEAAEDEHRHEYWEGDLWAMTGTTPEHNDLVFAFARHLRDHLMDSPCRTYTENIRTRVSQRKYVYPDVVVACPPDFDRSHKPPTLQNPKVVVEVLSESTRSFDQGDKLRGYYAAQSVQEVFLANSDNTVPQHNQQQKDGTWLVRELGIDDILRLESLSFEIPVRTLYEDV